VLLIFVLLYIAGGSVFFSEFFSISAVGVGLFLSRDPFQFLSGGRSVFIYLPPLISPKGVTWKMIKIPFLEKNAAIIYIYIYYKFILLIVQHLYCSLFNNVFALTIYAVGAEFRHNNNANNNSSSCSLYISMEA